MHRDQLQQMLKRTLAKALYLELSEIKEDKSFIDLGLDSIVGVEWIKVINKELGLEIPSTKIYDYPTVRELASFLEKVLGNAHLFSTEKLPSKPLDPISQTDEYNADNLGITRTAQSDNGFSKGAEIILYSFPSLERKIYGKKILSDKANVCSDDKIAIIGMSGRYPQANNLEQYWENLAKGKNSIIEIPLSRWNIDHYYDPDPTKEGKMYCKWLGLLDDVDLFDPLFFQISPSEAETMDPQHRLFLQESYKAFEDAGYSRKTLSNSNCGVYLGIMNNDYGYLLTRSDSSAVNITGNSFSIGAARLAYFLNLKGPAIPIDTACSSSLVAIHIACQALLNHEIDMALAGGVSLYLMPEAYVGMCQAGMLSSDGQCKTFDDSANGFVPGEGVGALVLKRLKDAEKDNDFIYGVILGSGINQDGKTNGITAPSVNSQIELEKSVYSRYTIDPETISYVETHGTGTKLGDPIELEALAKVFNEKTSKKNYCALGAVKTNIGHTSGAAGVASVQKVLLSLQNRTLAPNLNITKENTLFDFGNSPFYISREKQPWNTGSNNTLRRAAISSFGFSGTNAHLVIEEYPQKNRNSQSVSNNIQNEKVIIPLSARTIEQLKQRVIDLLNFVCKNEQSMNLIDMSYTLQVGRDEMKERLGFMVDSVEQLKERLQAYIVGQVNIEDFYQGQVAHDKDILSMFGNDADLQKIIDTWINDKRYSKILDLWVKGLDLNWNKLYSTNTPKRVSLPTYPFAKERYWIDLSPAVSKKTVNDISTKVIKGVEKEIQKKYYHPIWKEIAIAVQNKRNGDFFIKGPILIVDTTDELYLKIKKEHEGYLSEDMVILVKLEHSYQEVDSTIFTIDPEDEKHYQKLIKELRNRELLPCQIVYQCPAVLVKKEQLNFNFFTLFNLSKAMITQGNRMPLRILSISASNNKFVEPQNAALGGFLKTLTLENPRYQTKCIEIQSDSDHLVTSSEKTRFVLDELSDKNWKKNEIRYTYQKDKSSYIRYVRDLVPYNLSENKLMGLLPLKEQGVYIISGGLGGLGLIFSEYLIKKFHCKLVIFGRSTLEREQEIKLNQLKEHDAEVIYIQANVSKLEDVKSIIRTTKEHFSQINGVIHIAGSGNDSLIVNKSKDTMDDVLNPKVYGTINLDEATKDEELDCFVLFSSIAGIMGNSGQSDYAYANHFLDSFAERRENLKKEQKRFGHTLSINWPYWEEGGMTLSDDKIAFVKDQIGIFPLPTKVGIQLWEFFLQSGLTQGIPLYGDHSIITNYITQELENPDDSKLVLINTFDSTILLEKTITYLKTVVGKEIKLTPELIDSKERFESFGIDSIIISRINVSLEKDLGILSKTLFYEYPTIEELAVYLTQEVSQELICFFELENQAIGSHVQKAEIADISKPIQADNDENPEPIAIIGIHGHYPMSDNLDTYWENLKKGKDLTNLVPSDRWDYEVFYDPDPKKASEGKIYCKWGGFISDIDKFDSLLFNIPPEEATAMDPQERLFMESVWATLEDAGYTRESLKRYYPKAKSADVGVFVGVTTNSYELLTAGEWEKSNITPSAHPWSIANRVSYFFDFQGPSVPVDTACSSSLVAIHLACESLKRKECQLAVAGGVNLYLHPSKFHSFCKNRMVSLDGKCRSFGKGGDGFVPGEGVGTVLLKPLNKAIADRDHIYGIIAGSAYGHGGRSNGYSAPNPNSQAVLIDYTLKQAQISPETIGYIEGHGTGTQLGDNLEVVSLTNAFKSQTDKKQFCPIGSVKANIGHSEAAAGISGVAKILLQFKHQQLLPSIYAEEVNPNISFEDSPFYIQQYLTRWEPPFNHSRRALINSFGAGGVNACMILEEYTSPKKEEDTIDPELYLVILSARNEAGLEEYTNRLLAFISKEKDINLTNLSYTLQVGREAMQERLAFIVSNRSELIKLINDWKQKQSSPDIYQGNLNPQQREKPSVRIDENALKAIYETYDVRKLAEAWVGGTNPDWERLYLYDKPMRISLPVYPFDKKRYWILDTLISGKKDVPKQVNNQLHPLVSYNSSTLKEVTFSSLLSSRDLFVQDHKVNKELIFPGAGFLEIANISGSIAGVQKVFRMKDIVWVHPLSFKNEAQLVQTILTDCKSGVEYQIFSLDDENEKIIHSEGKMLFQKELCNTNIVEENMSVKQLKEKCTKRQDAAIFYDLFRRSGIDYGPAFQTIQTLYLNEDYALSELKITDCLEANFDEFILHPSIVDGALQTVAGLLSGNEESKLYLPFAIDELDIIRPLSRTCYVYVESVESTEQLLVDVKKFNIRIFNKNGDVLVKINHFSVKALKNK